MQKSINETLNKANYKVTEGEYAGYDVKFDLQFVPSDRSDCKELAENAEYNGIPIGNTFEKSLPELSRFLKKNEAGYAKGGVTKGNKNVIMNSRWDFKRERIHELFHTFFYNNDGAKEGIGNYKPGTDLPNQDDINKLINNPQLIKVEE